MDVNDVVQGALSRVAVPENIEVVTSMEETLPQILADPDQLGQVFGNIILNAIQAMPEGGQLLVKSEAPSPEQLSVSFTDTGTGIPEENLSKIFEPLFTTKAKGIGLGLAVCQTLVEGHGGTIEVESAVGKGSTFTRERAQPPLRSKKGSPVNMSKQSLDGVLTGGGHELLYEEGVTALVESKR